MNKDASLFLLLCVIVKRLTFLRLGLAHKVKAVFNILGKTLRSIYAYSPVLCLDRDKGRLVSGSGG